MVMFRYHWETVLLYIIGKWSCFILSFFSVHFPSFLGDYVRSSCFYLFYTNVPPSQSNLSSIEKTLIALLIIYFILALGLHTWLSPSFLLAPDSHAYDNVNHVGRLTHGILNEKWVVCRIPTLPLAFTVRTPCQKIYVLPFAMSELC